MPRVLIVYATNHGHTARIAARIATVFDEHGIAITVREVGQATDCRIEDFDGVLVAASIHAGHHQEAIKSWVRSRAHALRAMPSAFVSVSLTAAEATEESRTATDVYIRDFEDDTGWQPDRTLAAAGALQYREYDFATRLAMRLMMGRGGHPTAVERDFDYTDWDAVAAFAAALATDVAGASRARPTARAVPAESARRRVASR